MSKHGIIPTPGILGSDQTLSRGKKQIQTITMSINWEDYGSSDSNDEDFVPGEVSDVSCESSDEGNNKNIPDSEGSSKAKNLSQAKKRRKKDVNLSSRKRAGGIKLENDNSDPEKIETDNSDPDKTGISNDNDEKNTKSVEAKRIEADQEKKKSKVDALWSDFLKDVEPPVSKKITSTKPETISGTRPQSASLDCKNVSQKKDKVTVTQLFDFAGEKVSVTKEVPSDSIEAKEAAKVIPKKLPVKQIAGISGVLKKLDKTPKMGVLEKSKLDWCSFKDSEGIENELDQYKKGKDGYLEKQDFLQRADIRQFELEKGLRTKERSQRK